MKDDDFKLLRGFADRRTDNCDCRVAFATEKSIYITEIRVDMYFGSYEVKQWISNQYKDDRIMNI